jgi:hypothetical protein
MTEDRKSRFSDDRGIVVIPEDGSAPYRLDGQPITLMDRDLIAGLDPLDRIKAETEKQNGEKVAASKSVPPSL